MPDASPGEYVCLSIEDNGCGIDDETQKHIFKPFFTTKGRDEGTGLGLSVVYGIVRQHKGWIDIDSELGVRTTFSVYLPSAQCSQGKRNLKNHKLYNFDGKGQKILVIEDSPQILKMLENLLGQHNFVVYLAATCREAEEIFRRENGSFSVIFSDVMLPDGNGLHLVNQFLDSNPHLQVVLASGYTDEYLDLPDLKQRGISFLLKPYSLKKLLFLIQ